MPELKETLFGVLTAVSLGVVSPYANAATLTCGNLAESYLEFAKSDDDASKKRFASGYFVGYVWGFIYGDAERDYALSSGVTAGQAAHVVGKFLRNNPQLWHLSRDECVHRALYATWPKV